MGQQWNGRRTAAGWLLAVGLAASGGCVPLHSVHPPPPECVAPCHTIPLCARNHVYVFLVHGVDPLDCANLTGVRDYVQSLGFHKTYYGQLFHTHHFTSEIRRLRCEDPDARFVLIGFSCGASKVHTIAQAVKDEGIPIDLVVYLSGTMLKHVPREGCDNVCRIVNIQTRRCEWNGPMVDGAVNTRLNGVGHFGTPTHDYTLQTLAQELAAVAARVPVVLPPAIPTPPEEVAPTPRQSAPQPEGQRDEWDFLKPMPRVGQ